MPSFVGLGFTLIGAWFLFQAFRSRRAFEQLRAAKENSNQADGLVRQGAGDHPSNDDQSDTESVVYQRRRNQELQKFGSGCAPIVAMGMVLMALGVAAIALIMNLAIDGPRRLSIFDILSLLFFAGAFAYSLLTRTYYSAITLTESQPDTRPAPHTPSDSPS